eukprot:TRINITY_DN1054_c0_g1_i6.p1 TRINITY_DN1054_c0_g1~~TRINITY_DN1054_c0_g1_i6.p1  ORF type:complete len:583 (-),score=186.42 TRINITY_DN1054_c0_g1_i6:154-1902(-)
MAIQASIHERYPEVAEEGYFCMQQTPMIYTNLSSPICLHLSLKLGLPSSSIISIQSSTKFGENRTLNVQHLITQIQSDVTAGRKPMMLLLSMGLGHIEDIPKLRSVCLQNNIWLHLEGEGLSLLLSSNPPKQFKDIPQADSLTITLPLWYNTGISTACTFFKEPVSPNLPTPPPLYHALSALPLWVFMQAVGQNFFRDTVNRATELVKVMASMLAQNKSIEIDQSESNSICVIFRYKPNTFDPDTPEGAEGETKVDQLDESLLNRVNQQLFIDLRELGSVVGIDTIIVDKKYCIRFQPLFTCNEVMRVEVENIEKFVHLLGLETTLIDTSVSYRPYFASLISKVEGLHNVQVENFVGIGAVRYFPSFLQSIQPLSKEVKSEIDVLNVTLATRLSQVKSSLFSEGKTANGDSCVCVGVDSKQVSKELIKEYVSLIKTTAESLDFSAKVAENISEDIRTRIKEAEEELRKENEDALYQEGLIRKLPLVGSLWGWWSPQPNIQIKGKAYDIGSGKLKSVEPKKINHEHSPSPPPSARSSTTPTSSPSSENITPPLATPTPVATIEQPQDTTDDEKNAAKKKIELN